MRLTVSINEKSYENIKKVASEKNISVSELVDTLIKSMETKKSFGII